ncbi:MAG: M23 family metallopeptidase [Rhodobacteraceae bacterium]|nr:M23 family metallopeptidase [Paracoccaceae bacterium]
MLLFLAVLAVQILLPVALITGHAFVRPASAPGLWLRSVSLLGLCGLLALVGFWAFPPWWTPYVLVVLAALATWHASRRLQHHGPHPGRWRRRSEYALSTTLLALVLLALPGVISGRQVPPDAVDIAFPLEPGRYLVINGGHHPLLNAHFMTLDDPALADYRGQSFAVDLIGIDRIGWRATTPLGTEDPADYLIFGQRVLAPCDGTVIHAVGDRPDLPVPELDTVDRGGNELMIDCGAVHVYLAHLRQGSLRVDVGDTVTTGATLAEVGNSGHSGEPHLHIHVQRGTDPEAPLRGEPLPVTFDGVFPVKNARLVRAAPE